MENIIYLPVCSPIYELNIRATEKCYKDLPISFKVALLGNTNQIFKAGYLTTNNFIKDYSPEVNCNLIKTTQLLPSTKQMIIRRGKNATCYNTTHMIIHDLSINSHIDENINFNHHNEIIGNYQSNNIIIEFQPNLHDDAEGKFYSMLNDEHVSEMESKSSSVNAITDIQSKMLGFLEKSTLFNTILGFITTIIIAYIFYKIILIIITNCTRQQKIIIQRITEPIPPEAQSSLLEYKITNDQHKKISSIYPMLEDASIVIPTTHLNGHIQNDI